METERPEKSELQWDEETLIYVDALECKIIDLESQNKEFIEREQRIRKFWDVAPSDFEVIANGKGKFESGILINNK